MAAEKFIRVTCKLPVGVVLGSEGIVGMARDALLDSWIAGHLSEMHQTSFSSIRKESSGPLTLTLECPESKRGELCDALNRLLVELVS